MYEASTESNTAKRVVFRTSCHARMSRLRVPRHASAKAGPACRSQFQYFFYCISPPRQKRKGCGGAPRVCVRKTKMGIAIFFSFALVVSLLIYGYLQRPSHPACSDAVCIMRARGNTLPSFVVRLTLLGVLLD